jgi:hypothetical protein
MHGVVGLRAATSTNGMTQWLSVVTRRSTAARYRDDVGTPHPDALSRAIFGDRRRPDGRVGDCVESIVEQIARSSLRGFATIVVNRLMGSQWPRSIVLAGGAVPPT